MYHYIFGPVPSRRLGMSLGIDLVPYKVCTLNCIYCECGATTKLTLDRDEYVPYEAVLKEVQHYMHHSPAPEYITFSGSGEPTLNSRFGEILGFIKKAYPDVAAAVLTNGTLLSDARVRSELLSADVVLPSLDAASERSFRQINRPHRDLNAAEHIRGLIHFREEYDGEIWLEVFIAPGYNDDAEHLRLLHEALLKINPDRIQLNSLDRPGVVEHLVAASRGALQRIADAWNSDKVEIIAAAPVRKKIHSYRRDTESAILGTISRRPCTADDLSHTLGVHLNEINKYLSVLEADKKIAAVCHPRGTFYQIL